MHGFGQLENGTQPLDAQTWFDSLRRLRARLATGSGTIEADLRLAYYLATLAPRPFALVARPAAGETQFEGLLAGKGFESAVMALISNELSYDVSWHSDDGATVARVWFNQLTVEVALDANAAAAALLEAWVAFLLLLGQDEKNWQLL